MPLRVTEQFVKSRSSDETLCEDRIVASEHFLAVIDGATSKSQLMTEELSAGVFISVAISAAIKTIPAEATCDEAIDLISRVVRDEKQKTPELKEHAAAAIVIASRFRREVWRVGDCLFRVNGATFDSKNTIESHIAAVRAAFNQVEILSGSDITELRKRDVGRELVMPLLRKQRLLMNSELDSPFVFGAIDGTTVPSRFREKVALPSEPCELVLCTDGYPKVFDSLSESESYLRSVLKDDPLCINRHIATKGMRIGDCSFDDRAYIRAEF